MKVTLENTSKVVMLTIGEATVPARVWEGFTEHGVACHAFITRIAVRDTDNAAEFERDLQEQRKPSAAVDGIPLRLIL